MTGLFPDAAPSVSLDRQIAAVEREIRMRHSVYPRRVQDKRMTPAKAAEEIAVMESVLASLQTLKQE